MHAQLCVPNVRNFPSFLKKIESKWQPKLARRFERERLAGSKSQTKCPRYILSMFPYPSGRLHLGHVRIYTSGDLLARYSKLLAKNPRAQVDFDGVVHPMGFDSFGLPAENAARERNLNPATWTNSNIKTMKQQLDGLALQFDWREATSNPSFYKWTQDLFLKLMHAGLAYKSFAQVNWDPIDKTVLADEQVDENGRSWRSGATVEKRYFRQWFIKSNAFVSSIYDAQDVDPDNWRDIIAIQRNWVGKPSGWIFYLPISYSNNCHDTLPIFTRRPELFISRCTKLVISNDHWLQKIQKNSELMMVNPFTGQLFDVIISEGTTSNTNACLAGPDGVIPETISIDKNLAQEQVIMQARLQNLGGYYTSDRYRDWLVSRQRFWGTPIPVILCPNCGYKPVDQQSLPIKLPNPIDTNLTFNKILESDQYRALSPLENLAPKEWLHTNCPTCNSQATRECETLDTLFDSSWYFLRYASEAAHDRPFDKLKVQPAWSYIGGKEHAAMHLFYARFITHFLHSLGELEFREPFRNLVVQGVVKSRTYKLNDKYISKSEADLDENKKKVIAMFEKMSKSKGNGVDPEDLLESYGIDATRFCLMSYANPRSERLWRTSKEEFNEVLSFLRRVALTVQEYVEKGEFISQNSKGHKIERLVKHELKEKQRFLEFWRNKCSLDATHNIEVTNQFRQYISCLHVLCTAIRNNISSDVVYTEEFAEALASMIIMLSPITPHLCEELWLYFSNCAINPLKMKKKSLYDMSLQVSDQPWPLPDDGFFMSGCCRDRYEIQ